MRNNKLLTDYDDFNSFSNLLRRIFSCLRSHSKDTHKLDTTKLSQFSINWNEIREGEFKSLNSLYNMYTK